MKIILSGIFSFIGLLLIFIINLSKDKGIIGLLVSPLVGAGVIFGIIFGVLVLLSKILNVDSILAENVEVEKETKESSDNASSIGNNINFTVSDDAEVEEKVDSSMPEETHVAGILGDTKYNPNQAGLGRHRGLALYSHMLSFAHPKTKERMEFHLNPTGEMWKPFFE